MKRKLALFLAIITVGVSLVGCGSTETEFLYLLNKINKIKQVQTTGLVTLNIGGNLLTEYESAEGSVNVAKILNGLEVRHNTIQSIPTKQFITKLEIKLPGETGFRPLTTIIMDQNVLYAEVGNLRNLQNELSNKYGIDEDASIPAEVDYVKYKLEGLENYNTDEILETYDLLQEVFIKTFKDFSTDLIRKEGNKYTFELTPESAIDVALKFTEYFKNNVDSIANNLLEVVNELPEEQFRSLMKQLGDEDNELTKEQFSQEILTAVEEIKADTDYGLTDEDLVYLRESAKQIEGSKITSSLEQINEKSYNQSSELTIKYLQNELTVNIKSDQTITELDTIDENTIKAPEGNIMDLSEYHNIYEQDESTTLTINTEENSYVIMYGTGQMDFGDMPTIITEGRTYLPLRQVGEMLGEDVQWEQSTKTPYVNQAGQRIDMGGLLIEGKAYVKIRDFEKLGYLIDWNNETKEVTIAN